jgi:hypothetical protein
MILDRSVHLHRALIRMDCRSSRPRGAEGWGVRHLASHDPPALRPCAIMSSFLDQLPPHSPRADPPKDEQGDPCRRSPLRAVTVR